MKKLMKNKKGFTIVELVIVIAVIGILAGVLIPTFGGIINRANESSAVQLARTSLTNVLSGNVQNGTLNSAEFVINNGSKTYQFSYANGKLDTEDSADGSVKAGEDNLGTNLALNSDGNAVVGGYSMIIIRGATESDSTVFTDKEKAAVIAAFTAANKTGDTEVAVTAALSNDSKKITVTIGSGNSAKNVVFAVYFNSDFSGSTVAFIK